MYKLNEQDYYKIENLVLETNYDIIWINSILNQRQKGIIYVDNLNNPKTAIIWHKCKNAIILGKFNLDIFENLKLLLNKSYLNNQNDFALSVIDKAWESHIDDFIANSNTIIHKYKRYKFKLNYEKYFKFKESINTNFENTNIIKINTNIYNKINFKYMPDLYWNSKNDFLKNGFGFCIYFDKNYVSIAFSGFLEDHKCDIGVETLNNYKGKNYATLVSTKLIDYCIQNSIEPIWSCRSDNIASIKLANKLGFEYKKDFAYYICE